MFCYIKMMTDKGLNEEPEIISSSESSSDETVKDTKKKVEIDSDSSDENTPVYEETETSNGFVSLRSSEIYIVDVDGEVMFYGKNLGHARRQAYKLIQNIMISHSASHSCHIDQPDHNTFVLTGTNKFCLISYDTPIATVSVTPLYRVREKW
jgi:hypothetical protein